MGSWQESADDARQCITIDRAFIKAYFRLGLALQNLGDTEEAISAIRRGLGVDAANRDLKTKLRELEELQRTTRVTSLHQQAEQQAAAGDLATALKTIDSALRLDASNAALVRMRDQITPRFQAQERSRKAALSPEERVKEEGDDAYQAARFEDAIEKYSRVLSMLPASQQRSELAIKCFSNRSAAYKQLSNFDGIIQDTTAVLEVEPENIKCIIRRAQALEAVERYRLALEDVRAVLAMGEARVGAQNWQIANGMLHRLNRVVQQLRQS